VPLPSGVSSHHAAWVAVSGRRPHPVRYAVDGDRLACFGDDGLAGVRDRTPVSVSIHEIAGGALGFSLDWNGRKDFPSESGDR
jgi:hypothetical protein